MRAATVEAGDADAATTVLSSVLCPEIYFLGNIKSSAYLEYTSGTFCVPLYPCSYSLGGPCHVRAGPDRLDLFQSAANGLGVPTLASSRPLCTQHSPLTEHTKCLPNIFPTIWTYWMFTKVKVEALKILPINCTHWMFVKHNLQLLWSLNVHQALRQFSFCKILDTGSFVTITYW